jgi:hypothetical protein
MLALSCKVGDTDDEVIIRFEGVKILRVQVLRASSRKVGWAFEAGDELEINRREIDKKKYPGEYR